MKKWISLLTLLVLTMSMSLCAHAVEAEPQEKAVQTEAAVAEPAVSAADETEAHKGLSRNQLFFGAMVVCVAFLVVADMTGGKED